MNTTAFVGISLDGFIARLDGSYDFLPADGGEPHGYEAFIATVDAIVVGRNTYETVLGFPEWPYSKPLFVLSTRPITPAPPLAKVEHLSGPPADIATGLAQRGFGHVYVDGGITIQRFLAAGRLDRIVITRVPVLIGTGIPLFGVVPRDLRLRHVATRQYPSGLVQSKYRVSS